MTRPVSVLFVCVHNAGRSQMAAAYLRAFGGETVDVHSAGSEPAGALHPGVVAAMAEDGIDLGATPRRLDEGLVHAADIVITMGCGDACPVVPGKRYLDWQVDDPAGQPPEVVRRIRDEVKRRVVALLSELNGGPAAGSAQPGNGLQSAHGTRGAGRRRSNRGRDA
jgi:arsenate reductase